MRGGHVPHRDPVTPQRLCRQCQQRPAFGESRVCKFCADANVKKAHRERLEAIASGTGLHRGKKARADRLKGQGQGQGQGGNPHGS